MMNEEIRSCLPEGCVLLDGPSFDNSIVGIAYPGPERVIYSLGKMIQEYMEENECTFEEAQEFIEYNTLRAIPYMGERAPLVVINPAEG